MEEPAFCSISGKGGESWGLNVYETLEDYQGFINLSLSKGGLTKGAFMELNNLSFYYLDREELSAEMLKVIKDCGMKFRGRQRWLSFDALQSGYIPYIYNQAEVRRMTNYLRVLNDAIRYYTGTKVDDVAFHRNEAYLYFFDEKKNSWTWRSYDLPDRTFRCKVPLLDEKEVKKLVELPQNKREIEVDILYTDGRLTDELFEKPLSIHLPLFVDHEIGLVLKQDVLNPEREKIEVIIAMLLELIEKEGRPQKIFIRNPEIHSILKEICEICEIQLILCEKLEEVLNVEKELYDSGLLW